jgi:hypothetical protein
VLIGGLQTSDGDDENYALGKRYQHLDADWALRHWKEKSAVVLPGRPGKLPGDIDRAFPTGVPKLGDPTRNPPGDIRIPLTQ